MQTMIVEELQTCRCVRMLGQQMRILTIAYKRSPNTEAFSILESYKQNAKHFEKN